MCGLCTEVQEFTQQGQCERHMTAVHSGFVFRCSQCTQIFMRKDQKHGCMGATLHRVKKETQTMTIEEEKEFETFQRGRGKYVVPYMKPLPLVFSDQPYLPGQTKKRAKFTEPPLSKKAKKEARQKQLPLHPTSTRPQSLKTTEFPSLPEKTPSKDPPKKETPPKKPTTDPSTSFPKTPESVRKSFKRLFGDTVSDSEEDEEQDTELMSPDLSVSEPIVTSTPIRMVTTETIREYSLTDATTQTDLPYPLTVLSIATSQRERVGLDVGGKLFVTSRTTLRNYPKSLLFKLVDDPTIKPCYIRDSLEVYFGDRDPEFFNIILHFYRDSVRNVVCHLPTHPTILRKLHIEAVFYELDSLAYLIGSQM